MSAVPPSQTDATASASDARTTATITFVKATVFCTPR